jgi:Zn-dependent protease with chaperone function
MSASISTPNTTTGSPPVPAWETPGSTGKGAGSYVISAKELSPGWVTLYAITFAIQVFCASVRATVAYPILWVVFKLVVHNTAPVHDLAFIAGYGPLALSFATLILPLGGWWWEQQAGARSPSEREQLVVEDAITTLRQADPDLRPPRRWCILDRPDLNASVYADTLMLTRGLLESGYLQGVLAHELGHLNSSDARLTAALYRLTTPPRKQVRRGLRTITLIATGGLAVMLTRAPWGAYWRAREHHADHYAANLGQAENLAQFLETEALDNDLPVPFIWLTDKSHPFTEHRIDKLQHHHEQATPRTQENPDASTHSHTTTP